MEIGLDKNLISISNLNISSRQNLIANLEKKKS